MNKFQIIVLGVLAGGIVIALLIFSGVFSGLDSGKKQFEGISLSIWGLSAPSVFEKTLDEFERSAGVRIKYFQKPENVYEAELVDALASGQGPDIWEMPHNWILKHQAKILPLGFEAFSERRFKDTFVEAGEVYLKEDGVRGLPFYLDPMVLYWNRDLFSNANIAQPPKDWEEFLSDARKLTVIDSSGNILQAGAALGEVDNISNFKEILSLLILQTGNPIFDRQTGKITLKEEKDSLNPAENALGFFVEFSDPAKSSYSWNRAMPSAGQAFSEGKLAMHLGFAGEYAGIKEKNPHLNFDLALIPQIKGSSNRTTFAKVRALVVSAGSRNQEAAWFSVFNLASAANAKEFSTGFFLPPSRRDLLSEKPTDAVLSVFYGSALISKTWLEPDPGKTSEIFTNMVKSVLSGRKRISQAVSDAHGQLQSLIK